MLDSEPLSLLRAVAQRALGTKQGDLLASLLALVFVRGATVRFTMGAFAMQLDNTAILIGCAIGLLLGILGAIPPAIRALRLPIVEGLKSV